jgi:hypothetical protein
MDTLIRKMRKALKSQLGVHERRLFDEEFFPEQTLRVAVNGSSNACIIAPHGFPGDDDNTDYLAYFLAKELDAPYLINNKKFYKPGKAHQSGIAADLNKPWHDDEHTRNFLATVKEVLRDVRTRCQGPPLVITIHGMSDANARSYGAGDFCIGAGYTASEREKAYDGSGTATASREVVEALLEGLKALGFTATDGIPQYSAKSSIPAFLKQNEGEIGPVNAVQMEIRYEGFRDTTSIIQTAKLLAQVVAGLPSFQARARASQPAPALNSPNH